MGSVDRKGSVMAPNYNQRSYTRIEVDLPVSVHPRDGEPFEATVTDISAGGLRIEHTGHPAIGTPVDCSFFSGSRSLIDVRGEVCFVEDYSFGVRLTGYDTVSYTHLKELLLSLADDPHAVEDEILLNLDSLPEAD